MPPTYRPAGPLREPYNALKKAGKLNLADSTTSARLLDLVRISLDFLNAECFAVDLISRVTGKTYFAYALKSSPKLLSRPINKDLFLSTTATVEHDWIAWEKKPSTRKVIEPLIYTMASAYCAASDLFDRNNKKGPATYFEHLIGHLFARELHVNPTTKVTLPVAGKAVRMTMDFIFDLGSGNPKVHLPVKLSTRERVVQAWAHQRLLDAAFQHGSYRGILVVHSETKLDSTTREVIEICVPDQWLAYQALLARMDRIYYFDMPERYAELARDFPIMPLKLFPAFFTEKDKVLMAPLT